MADNDLIYTGPDLHNNWFYNKYYYSGANGRYYTFHTVLNLLNQHYKNPIIIETGCQRLEDDIGGGMSTSIFAEYISRYGGKLISVDISPDSVQAARKVLQKFSGIDAQVVQMDSVAFLKQYQGKCDLLYLDSYDYPIFEMCNMYGGQTDMDAAMKRINDMGRDMVVDLHKEMILPPQQHCLEEFKAIESRLDSSCMLLIDDNQLAGGGKPRLLKEYLIESWICLMDFQQSLWISKEKFNEKRVDVLV